MNDIRCILIEPHKDPVYINVHFGFEPRDNTPSYILGGSPTILGANPDEDLVLFGRNQNEVNFPYWFHIHTNSILDSFNMEENLRGPLLIMKTNLGGDPIDCDFEF